MIQASSFMIFFGFLSYYSSIVENFILLLLKQFEIQRYTILYDKDLFKSLLKRLETECVSTDVSLIKNRKSISGWFWSKQVVGYLSIEGSYDPIIKISFVCTKSYFNYLTEEEEEIFFGEEDVKVTQSCKISVFSRYGHWKMISYSRVFLDVSTIEPVLDQSIIVKDIVKFYNKKRQCKVFIEGPPCSGKSSIGYLVAKEIRASFCNTFNPTEPGDTVSSVISRVKDWIQDDDTPLVILIDEVDTILKKVHNNQIKLHDEFTTLVSDKPSWSKFMDNLKFSKNLIVIFTSNTSKQDIDLMDKSYIRQGRIDLYHKLLNSVYTDDGKFIGDSS